ncbi:MAG: hypothetical protein KL785_00815 [Brevundimonas sp.]|nr:hypothetical protein [Brevundimonas sp.]
MDERYDAGALRLARAAAMEGETVLWAGRPGRRWIPGWMALKPALVLVMVAVWLGWSMRKEPEQLMGSLDNLGVAFLILAVPAAVGLALGIRNVRRRNREVYAVTDGRVLILAPDGGVRHAVGLERADEFRRAGRTVSLGGEDEVWRQGKTDLDGGLARFEALPRLERLADAEQVMATIRRAAARYAA